MKRAWLAVGFVAVGLVASCAVGRPPGFSNGPRWTFPLVDPLSDGLLVTPVYVRGQGPFLFAIDPEANVTIIDERVAIAAKLRIDRGYTTRLWAEDGQPRVRFNAELLDLVVGNLYVETRRALVVPHETLSAAGRPIMGVLGRNVISDSLVFGFDRDRGVAWLQEVSSFTPPTGATKIAYTPTPTYTPLASAPLPRASSGVIIDESGQADPSPFGSMTPSLSLDQPDEPGTVSISSVDGHVGVTDNKAELPFVHANIGGRDLVVSVQLGSAMTRLRDTLAAIIGAPQTSSIEYDATGARRVLAVGGTTHAEAAGAINDHTTIARFVDRSELPSNARFFDGTLGLDFFAPFVVYANWTEHAFYVAPRATSSQLGLRLGRWSALARCEHAGCVSIAIRTPSARAAAPPSDVDGFVETAPAQPREITSVLHVTRDAASASALEVRLRASGQPDMLVELPAGVRDVLAPIRGDAANASYEVVDASPFATGCPGDGGCVLTAR